MSGTNQAIKDGFERDCQRYIDHPVYETILPKPMAVSVAKAIGIQPPLQMRLLTGYERERLKWITPGRANKLSKDSQ